MSTIPQLNANRRNSQKSTGPRTDAGKAVSSQNALKTGIYSQAEVVYGEDAADLRKLTDEYYAEYHPESATARSLVDVLVHSEWTLRRLRRAEAQLWKLYMDRNHDDDDGEDSFGFAIDRSDGKVFARLQRRIDATQRNLQRALKDLKEGGLQPAQGFSPAPEPRTPPRIPPQPATEIGFVPSIPQPQPAQSITAVPAPQTVPSCASAPPTPGSFCVTVAQNRRIS